MPVLGIETSCDETGVAVYDGAAGLRAHAVYSQVEIHAQYGGVVPELASRDHVRKTLPLIRQVLDGAGMSAADIRGVAYTAGPGLIGALLVGAALGRSLAWAWNVPAIAVHHMEGHLLAPLLEQPAPEFPFVALLVSGGHTQLVDVEGVGRYRMLGESVDDAAGEAFDKTAKILGLPYPGGPVVDRLARSGDADAVPLPRPRLRDSRLDFSFSGLKSAAVRWIREHRLDGVGPDDPPPEVRDLLASFERAVVDQLLAPMPELVERHRPNLLTASGGVAANSELRRRLERDGAGLGLEVRLPPPRLTTDNAAMVARAGQLAYLRGDRSDPRRLDARPREAWQPPGMRGLSQAAGVV
jgi:N6-L-threonylcarbamoyladenine synthase